MEHYSFYNINKLFILIIDQTIISHYDKFINYNDKCITQLRHWPHTLFRYRLDLPYKLIDPTQK